MTFSVLPQIAFVFMLIFARVGTMVMLMPGVGEQTVSINIRLAFAIVTVLVLYPLVGPYYTAFPSSVVGILPILVGEVVIGLFIGLSIRLVLAAVQLAGTIIAFQIGISFAQSFNATLGIQGTVLDGFMTLLAIVMIFKVDLHHLLIAGFHDSFMLFPPGQGLPSGDLLMMAIQAISESFRIGTQISAPFIVFGLLFYLGVGLLQKLMPQAQIFFVAMPANIGFGLMLFIFLLAGMMMWYLEYVKEMFGRFLV
ncbi:flagellar biosynthetic protein FliR [Coralliovum pocilloporae]|uniref:flagellar biosynthetic protein FliR n=1 Tax=Coralliovum pocilloporae TaxID=3066369 RepID=UPI003306D233